MTRRAERAIVKGPVGNIEVAVDHPVGFPG